jgi:AcrR family transcriptional regulator
MALRPYARRSSALAPATETRVLEAAEALIKEGAFHRASVGELAERAGVSRATVFGRFKSKLGVLEALATRCAGGPEIAEIRAAFALEDARAAVTAVVAAACGLRERQGHILVTLKAIVELEPGALTLIEAQRVDQATSIAGLVKRLVNGGALRPGLLAEMAIPTLHLITSVEAFLELRRHGGLSFEATCDTLTALALTLLA